jgi:hypothetical protein
MHYPPKRVEFGPHPRRQEKIERLEEITAIKERAATYVPEQIDPVTRED